MSIASRRKTYSERPYKKVKIKEKKVKKFPVLCPSTAEELAAHLETVKPLRRSPFLINCGTQRETLNMIDKARGLIIGKRAFAFNKAIVNGNNVFRGIFVRSLN